MDATQSLYSDPKAINLYSDTQTRPTAEMRKVMAEAEVGDEQHFADPTTMALEQRVAELLGHESGIFLPSGTMANQIAIRLNTEPSGDAVLLDSTSHILNWEAGAPAVLSGVIVQALDGNDGTFTADQLAAALNAPQTRYTPRHRLVCIEQTANRGGGRVWPLHQIEEVAAIARGRGLRLHLDGARLLNASIAANVHPASYCQHFDTAWIDLSKGLGAPVGAVLVGSRELVNNAWRFKQMWGGAMRQSGILAAAGLYALDRHVDRLAIDHANAALLARGLAEIGGVQIDPERVETNIVYFHVADPRDFVRRLAARGILMGVAADGRVRAVTHLDVTRPDIDSALEAVAEVMA